MKKRSFRVGSKVWLGWVAAGLVLAGGGPGAAFGAERMVLCEEFTSIA